MRAFLLLLAALALGLAGALAWNRLAVDPGYVLITFRGWSIEASLAVVLALLVLAWVAVGVLVLLLRGPFRWWRRRRRSRARARLAEGVVLRREGRLARAERQLLRAAGDPVQRPAALLLALECARDREDAAAIGHHLEALDRPPSLARLLAAEALLRAGDPEQALHRLGEPGKTAGPAAWILRARCLLACGRAVEALAEMHRLRRACEREGVPVAAIEVEIAVAALQQAVAPEALDAAWAAMPSRLRAQPSVLEALAAAARRHGRDALAARELLRVLDRHDEDGLAVWWGRLEHEVPSQAIRHAERWLEARPQRPGLLLALGRLCHREQLWGKAEAFLRGALDARPVEAWEALGDLHADRGDASRAQQAYRNALRAARGEAVEPLRALLRAPEEEVVSEQRSSMGLPQLPGQRTL
ncbi:MAG: porphyrin biosynthesis protein [Lysobacteraceae bacterium]|nr:MAG: porphyrin biosynthesis protein [Xanthomonadaceae bacterium]